MTASSEREFRDSLVDFEAEIKDWHVEFLRDIHESSRGYPLRPVREFPDLEDRIRDIGIRAGLEGSGSQKELRPAICLTHDLDNLQPTLQMRLKRLITQRKLRLKSSKDDFLSSLETLLKFNNQIAGKTGCSTVFVACKSQSPSVSTRLSQWLIDPAYSPEDADLGTFLRLLDSENCEVGLHGSFFSLSHDLLSNEKEILEEVLGRPVSLSRQHWLHLPTQDSMEKIWSAGLRIDSSLGWNGNVGFRCGMARPFPIVLDARRTLWEVPLLLMDGPIFDDLGLDFEGAISLSRELLGQVKERGGCVAINWHERAASPDYNWFEAYQAILNWAKEEGFRFVTLSEAVQEYSNVEVRTTG